MNSLQNDQDFYALSHCRVPVRRFGLFHELSTVVNLNDQSTTNTSLSTTNLLQQDHHAFLNAMDRDLVSMRAKVEQIIDTKTVTTTATALIPDQPTTYMLVRSAREPVSELNCDGADCGCKHWHIVTAIILIALLIPLIYIYIYIKHPSNMVEHLP